MSKPEPEWSRADRLLVQAFALWKADLGPHGYSMAEATSKAADPNNRNGTVRFTAGTPYIDYAERAHSDAEKKLRDAQGEKWNPAGVIIPVVRTEYRTDGAE